MAEQTAVEGHQDVRLRGLEGLTNLVRVLALLGLGSIVPLVDGMPPSSQFTSSEIVG
jgi:hypothetical protein